MNGSQGGADFLALDLGGPGQEGTGHSEQGFMQMELAQQQGDVGSPSFSLLPSRR